MKKFISILLAIVTIISTFTFVASATTDESEDTMYRTYIAGDGLNMLRIVFPDKYTSFGDEVTVTLCEGVNYDENVRVISGDELICVIESTNLYNRIMTSPVIYVSCGEMTGNENLYAFVSENSVFDDEGNGNSETRIGYRENTFKQSLNISNKDKDMFFTVGDEITYTLSYPVDFYINDSIVAENAVKYTLKVDKKGDYKVTIKKFDAVLYEESYNTSDRKSQVKSELRSNIAGSALASFGCIFLAVLSPLLMIFPPLGAAVAASPFITAGVMFMYISEYFEVLFR